MYPGTTEVNGDYYNVEDH